jgi:hypothetical protein
VKVYIGSDYGFDYMASTQEVAIFDWKKVHNAACEKLGLHSITVCCGAFMDWLRTPLCGMVPWFLRLRLRLSQYPFFSNRRHPAFSF